MKTASDILRAYCEIAESVRDGAFFVQARARKPYLTKDVIRRWHIGKAPTLKQCEAKSLSYEELFSVGLGRERSGRPDVFYRDSMVFPWIENGWHDGRIIYVSTRRLIDLDQETQQKLDGPKSLVPPLPGPDGKGGLVKPACFNADILRDPERRKNGVLIVEGCPDAIACCERGHAAVALQGSVVRDCFVELLDSLSIDPVAEQPLEFYLALDGTKDINEIKLLGEASRAGPATFVCQLPQGQDPDDQDAASLEAIKARALSCLDTWLTHFAGPPATWAPGASERFKSAILDWLGRDRITRPDVERHLESSLRLTGGEVVEFIGAVEPNGASPQNVSGAAAHFLDRDLPLRLQEIAGLRGTGKAAAGMGLIKEIAPLLAGATAIQKEMIKTQFCASAGIGKRAYDQALKEAWRQLKEEGKTKASAEADWAALAESFLVALAAGNEI